MPVPSNATGYYDSHGIPIHVGDLIRVRHYKHVRSRRQMWVYFRVSPHPPTGDTIPPGCRYVLQSWECLDDVRYVCLLSAIDCGAAEVLAESNFDPSGKGKIVTFNERKRGGK